MTDVTGNPQDQKDPELNEEELRIENRILELKEEKKNLKVSSLETEFENADLTALMTEQQVSNEDNQPSQPMINVMLFVGCFKNRRKYIHERMFLNSKNGYMREYYLFVIDSLSIVEGDSQSLFRNDDTLLAFLQFLKDLKSEIL